MFRSMLVIILEWLSSAVPSPHCNYCRPYPEFDVYAETENDKAATEGFLGHSYKRVQNMECKSKPEEIFFSVLCSAAARALWCLVLEFLRFTVKFYRQSV
ncbi:unnamed protein product [Macrosiphum euphorbiae]|uniref:Secreted protein n=1 Tax=Macrosiphum euphorbiae TaxID=13131 RepID=A0AAV0VUD4_9HEMI|nr:unnamed protein product [Macrosiphum euphorbiae]